MGSLSQMSESSMTDRKQWMSQLCEKLWDVPLFDLAIPGSHDTMTYGLDRCSPLDPDLPKLLFFLAKAFPSITRNIILRWSTTQTLSVAQQLDVGIRYLDLRIAHRPDVPSPNLYFVHGFYTSMTVEETLHEISDWMKRNPKEMLIISCKNLQSMSPVLHMHLINCIHGIFGSRLCPKHEQPTLRNMWQKGFQVIVSYDNPLALKYEYLWPSMPYWWGNTTNADSLISFLDTEKHKGRPDGFFVAGLNLTENAFYILTHPFGSMKKLTLPKLPFLNSWVQRQHPGHTRDATNIIAEDLVDYDHFISTVIGLNRKLLVHKK
ncbi:PI-PLC X domain-containing protein 1 [Hyperolius riggenbachi]|uniref:PI-PLC X domain-containing protein 1 n=1 Tax=Hyperolius riggenbachi TaxID=752182 RepID=UPI0035A38FBE